MKKLVTIAIAALAGQLLADTITWTGGGDGYTWSDGNNWSSGSNPGASFTADLVIDDGISPGGIPSTVIKVLPDGTLQTLRP